MIESTPRIITGSFAFTGAGYGRPVPLEALPGYAVPPDKRAQLIYFRAGNSTAEMIAAVLLRDGKPMRAFPVAARGATHVPLAVVEDLFPETRLDLQILAPEGVAGWVVLDIGLMEI